MVNDSQWSRQWAHGGCEGWIFQEAWRGDSGLSNLELTGREGPAGIWLTQPFPPLYHIPSETSAKPFQMAIYPLLQVFSNFG